MEYKEFIKNQDKCPFCNLKEKEILIENSFGKIILARAPHHKHHLLIVPNNHYVTLFELNKKEQKKLFDLIFFAQKIITQFYKNFTIVYREGKSTGKSIEHMHVNIIPEIPIAARGKENSDREIFTEKEYYEVLEELKERIKEVK